MDHLPQEKSDSSKIDAEYRHRLRHSASHVMAGAVASLFPEVKFGIGPATNDGFYYDFLVSQPFSPLDLTAIEAKMISDISQNLKFEHKEISLNTAQNQFSDQPFKLEIISEIPQGEAISIYQHGMFEDLCEGPHVNSTSDILAFKLLSIAGAYWRGDEKRPMLQRIYGTAFESQEALDDYMNKLEEAQRRDHRILGRDLGLFMMDPVSPASPFFLPKGTVVYNLLTKYIREIYASYGYEEVITPQIFDTELWRRSGHYDNYKDNMYFFSADEREYGLKPMNCPAHAIIFSSKLRSYRELPVRLADFGRLHRFERSGVTHGLTRVRSFSQDDAHIFCTPSQINQELQQLIKMFQETYRLFHFDNVRLALSLRPEKRVGSDEFWDIAESALNEILESEGLSYDTMPGEGAFYGPKIDFFVPDAIGREWQLGTIQLDFSMPNRFDLEYITDQGSRERPVVIHRAMLGSLDRFLGVLIEHYSGAFPTWLAPVQVAIIPIADRHVMYAQEVKSRFLDVGLRVEIDERNERMNAKVREAQLQKFPYMLIVGDKEISERTVSVRIRSGESPGAISIDDAIVLVQETVASRSI